MKSTHLRSDPRKLNPHGHDEWILVTLHTSGRVDCIAEADAQRMAAGAQDLLATLGVSPFLGDVQSNQLRVILSVKTSDSRSLGEVIDHLKDATGNAVDESLTRFRWRIGAKMMRLWDHDELLRAEQYLRQQHDCGASLATFASDQDAISAR